MYVEILTLIVALVIVSLIAFIISTYVLVGAPSPALAETSRVSRNGKQMEASIMPWSEELRGGTKVNNIMPPCFNVSVDAGNIYRIVETQEFP